MSGPFCTLRGNKLSFSEFYVSSPFMVTKSVWKRFACVNLCIVLGRPFTVSLDSEITELDFGFILWFQMLDVIKKNSILSLKIAFWELVYASPYTRDVNIA